MSYPEPGWADLSDDELQARLHARVGATTATSLVQWRDDEAAQEAISEALGVRP